MFQIDIRSPAGHSYTISYSTFLPALPIALIIWSITSEPQLISLHSNDCSRWGSITDYFFLILTAKDRDDSWLISPFSSWSSLRSYYIFIFWMEVERSDCSRDSTLDSSEFLNLLYSANYCSNSLIAYSFVSYSYFCLLKVLLSLDDNWDNYYLVLSS